MQLQPQPATKEKEPMNEDLTDLKNRILEQLDELPEEDGWNLVGMARSFRDFSMDGIELAVRELLLEEKIVYWGEDDLEEDGDMAAVVLAEPGWALDVLNEIDDLPEVP
jgi:hypothetical protein